MNESRPDAVSTLDSPMMKTLRLFVALAALLFAGVAAPSPARAETSVSFDFFYDSLAPYGDWVQVGDYGLCWRPNGVDPDWTPYSDGYWAYTDAGWTWVSYEEFGGIVYHYGRWIRLDDDSWCWAPDYEWGPAWVAWRSNDDYVGWAPLPPEARWRRDVGISVWVDRECDLGPGYYSFCRVRDFGAPVLRGVLINRRENVTIIRSTVNVTNITYNTTYVNGPIIFNGGPNFASINRFSSRPIPALKLVQEANFDSRHRGPNGRMSFQAQTVGNQLIVGAPRVLRPTDPGEFRSRAKRVYAGDSVTRGWSGVKDPGVQKELRQEMGRQAKGLTPQTAPARAVAAADLKVVPSKADPTATLPTTTTTERRSDHPERPDRNGNGKGQRPDSVVVQPNNNPPTTSTTPPQSPGRPTAPAVTSTPPSTTSGDPTGVARGRGRDKSDRNPDDRNTTPPGAPTANNPNLKPFNPEPNTRPPQNPPTGPASVPRTTNTDDNAARERAAEQARVRGEQQQRMEQQRLDQQRQAESAARQKQADMAAEQQKQIGAQQEAARARADEQRRRDASEQQRQQQQQLQSQQQQQQQLRQQQQEQQQRAFDARRGQDADRAARERAREQSENQRPPQTRQQPPQPQPQPQQNNQGGNGSPRPGGGGGQHSKDGKDKDKDKDRN